MRAFFRRMSFRGEVFAVLVLLGICAPLSAAEFDRARALYENHCQSCHEDWAHTGDGRKVASLEGLRARVASWSVHSGLQWSDGEIDEVTAYLNRRFYRLVP